MARGARAAVTGGHEWLQSDLDAAAAGAAAGAAGRQADIRDQIYLHAPIVYEPLAHDGRTRVSLAYRTCEMYVHPLREK